MTTYYWYGDGGNWSDFTNHWSLNSGNSPASAAPAAPTSAIDVRFDALSFTTGSQTVTVDAVANCKDMDWTGATNTPTLAFTSNYIQLSGNVTFIAAMANTRTTSAAFLAFTGTDSVTITTNGLLLVCGISTPTAAWGKLTQGDNLSTTNYIAHRSGEWDTGGYSITQSASSTGIVLSGPAAKTLTLNNSTITCTFWNYSGSNLTLTANTATINCSGSFTGGSLLTYYIVNLTGATSTISGNNTFNTIVVDRSSAAKAITATGTTQTVNDFRCAMNGKNGLAITGGTWILPNARRVITDFLTATNMTVSAGQWYAGYHSTDGGGNSGLMFRMPNRDKMICGVNL